jgi:hypothetical protein
MGNPSTTGSVKDNMSIGSAESIAPRWVSPDSKRKDPMKIHWVGVLRDDTLLSEYCNEPDNPKILQMSRRFLKKNKESTKVDWEFKTYAVQSQRRMVHAIKFRIYDKIPLGVGARAKLVNLASHSFLNGECVRILEYQRQTNKYLIRPSIPLPDIQKIATTGMLVVHAKNVVAAEQEVRVWTFAALYDGKKLTQNTACQFMERLLVISENFRGSDEWWMGGEMSCQSQFGPILTQQVEQFCEMPEHASIDDSLDYSKHIIDENMDIVSSRSSTLEAV